MDDVYALPYCKDYHPSYREAGGVPAISEVKFSLVSNRGCFGGCSFCALTFHQGRIIQTRSHASIMEEAREMTKDPEFKGYIHDVGGPTANFRRPSCDKQLEHGVCKNNLRIANNKAEDLSIRGLTKGNITMSKLFNEVKDKKFEEISEDKIGCLVVDGDFFTPTA